MNEITITLALIYSLLGGGMIYVFNENDNKIIGDLHSDGEYAINSSETSSFLHWIDTATNKIVSQMEFVDDESKLCCASGVSGDAYMINVKELKVEKTIKVGGYSWGLAAAPEDYA